ncbi:MAG: biotin/lipoyl-containing protein, partial [Jiangellales bacterium]
LTVAQDDVERHGHAVEVRLVAEDPAACWVPSSGTLVRFEPPDVPGVRWDSGVASGSAVPPYYDSLIAKIIAHAPTRDEALDRMRAALRGLRVHGVATNRQALLTLVDDPDVRAGRTTIDLLEARAAVLVPDLPAGVAERHAIAAALAVHADADTARPTAGYAPRGWRSMADAIDTTVITRGAAEHTVTQRTDRAGTNTISVDGGEEHQVVVTGWDGEWLVHEIDGVRRRAGVLLAPERDDGDRSLDVFSEGHATSWVEPARLPAGDRAEAARGPSSPVPGTIVAVRVAPGDVVASGDALVVLEAMKMEHRITADTAATVVEVAVAVGDAVDAHEVLVVLEPLTDDQED